MSTEEPFITTRKPTQRLHKPFLYRTTQPPIMLTNLNGPYLWYWVTPIIASVGIFFVVVCMTFIQTRKNKEPKMKESERRFSFLGPGLLGADIPIRPKPSPFFGFRMKRNKEKRPKYTAKRKINDGNPDYDYIFLQVRSGENFTKLKKSLQHANMRMNVSEDEFASYVITEEGNHENEASSKDGQNNTQTRFRDESEQCQKTPIVGPYPDFNEHELSSEGRESPPAILHLTPSFRLEKRPIHMDIPSGSKEYTDE